MNDKTRQFAWMPNYMGTIPTPLGGQQSFPGASRYEQTFNQVLASMVSVYDADLTHNQARKIVAAAILVTDIAMEELFKKLESGLPKNNEKHALLK